MKSYYINFNPQADINYLYLLSLYDIASYNPDTRAFDTIHYTTISQLAEMLPYSVSTLNRILSNERYKDYLSIDKKTKTITLNNSVIAGSKNRCFVRLNSKEVVLFRNVNDNLFCRYYIYMKYYCNIAKLNNMEQNFTAKQFLTTIGYSTNSQSQIDKISYYNNVLKENNLIRIRVYKDEFGHNRNIYKLNDEE